MSSPLDFLISMVVVFLAFGVLVSGFVETWNSYYAKRGRFLWQGIARILGDTSEGRELYKELRRHPAIAALSRDGNDEKSLASYIPSSVFSAALVDLLMTRGTHVSLEKFSLAEAIVQLPDNFELKKILLMIWRREQGQIERVEAGLAVYFDQCMDRVSGWYKRDAQVRSVCFGLVLAVLLNIDAVHIASALWQDRDLARSTATKAAPPGQSQIAGDKAQEVRLPAELPLGWPPRWYTEWQQQLPDSGDAGRRKTDATLQFVWHVAAAILGFILMGLSCLIAAPVWYQLLASLLPLRAAGPVPGRSADNTRTDATLPAGTQEPDASRTVPLLQPNDLERQLMANNRVKEVQTWLRAPNTGVFDAETRLAIRNAQSAYGFAPTGQLTQWLLIQLQQRVAAN